MLYRDFATQEELDREYDVESIHPDFPGVVDRVLALSAAARSDPNADLDVPFGPTRDERLDIFRAAGASAPRPVLVFVHGGYWRLLSSADWALVAPGPVARGIDVVVTNYSLCPKVTIDEITRQTRAALVWVAANAASWGGDPTRIFVAGHSAGGQQVAMAFATDWEGEDGLPANLVRGGIAVSGLYDLRPLPYTFVAPALQLSRRTIETQSPQLLPPSGPPRIIAWGGGETSEFVRQSRAYLDHCRAAGLDARALELGSDDHFEAVLQLGRPDSELTGAVVELLSAGAASSAGA